MDVIKMAKFSRIAYKKDSRVKEELKKLGYDNIVGDLFQVETIHVDDLSCFITQKNGETIIAIRGSSNLKNWLRDFDIGKEQLAQGRVHGGFLRASEKLYEKIKRKINYKNKIYLTGHSLGGAIATLIANFLYEDFKNVAGLITFECPNIADKRYIKNTSHYTFEKITIKNNIDILTRLPPNFLEYYNYNCDLIYFNKEHLAILNPSKTTIFIDRIKTYITPLNWKEIAEDHLMDNVLSLVLKNKDIIERIDENGERNS